MSDQPAAGAPNSPSLILALHTRYERAWEEYNRIDEARPPKPENSRSEEWTHYFSCEAGLRANSSETDLIHQAILYQVPRTDEELAVLIYHLWSAWDPATTLTEQEGLAMEEGLASVFDYLADRVGPAFANDRQFANGAKLAMRRRRYRTGLTDQDD